ncbi:hypothetical protein [Thermus caliditerrae]|uniref:hypothetical protein n=1 Tax=Thermus caliditerrae TaxID=1330700 RepID=UPI001F180195|nr:hypothetical protein [Thermus caliditerrae]
MAKGGGWVLGLTLVLLGVLLLLQNLGLALGRVLLGVLLLGGGGGFLVAYGQDRGLWWALIPGFGLLGLGLALLLGEGAVSGALFLLGLGLGFWAVFAVHRDHWWAVIPGGVLLTLALVALVEGLLGVEAGWFLFVGLALTFGLLFFLGQRWALWPALGVLVPLGLASEGLKGLLAYAFPLALVGAGAYLLWRSVGKG